MWNVLASDKYGKNSGCHKSYPSSLLHCDDLSSEGHNHVSNHNMTYSSFEGLPH
jgi:hypothetical protein